MEQIVINLLKLQNQFKILHWQTESFAQHKTFDKAYNTLGDLIDKLVETHQGKYGRLNFNSPFDISLVNIADIEIENVLKEAANYLITTFSETHSPDTDSDCLNIRDEILSEINKLRYLLTLS